MYKKIIHILFKKQFQSITSAAIIISLTSLASRFLGLIRDHMLARQFGAGSTLDIYYAAFRIPDLIYNLLVLGALSAGFIPVFTSYLKIKDKNKDIEGTNDSWNLVNNILHIMIFIIGALSLLMMIITPYLMHYIVPGFSSDQLDITVRLTQIMFLSPFFLSISSLFGGILQSFKRFLVFSLAPILYNLGIIIGIVWFYNLWGINGLGWGVVLGTFLHMMIQIPTAVILGYRYKWIVDFGNKGLRKIAKMMIPRTLGLAITQINLIVITIIASTLNEGALSVFNFANNLQSVPVGLFGISFAIAAFPTMAHYADKKKMSEFKHTFSSVCRQIIFFIVPVSFLFIIFRAQIVRLVLGAGAFNWEDTIVTFGALGIFSLSLFAQSLIPVLARTFYTLHDSKTPFYIAFFAMITNIVLSVWLGGLYDILGLVWAFTLSAVLQFILLWIGLHVKVGDLEGHQILFSSIKIVIASSAMALVSQGSKYFFGTYLNINTVIGILTQTVLSIGIGILVFIAVSILLKSQEMLTLKKSIKKRLFKQIEVPQAKLGEETLGMKIIRPYDILIVLI